MGAEEAARGRLEKKRVGLILRFLTAGGWDRGLGGGGVDQQMISRFWFLPAARLFQRLHLLHGQHDLSLGLSLPPHCHTGRILTTLFSLPRFSTH